MYPAPLTYARLESWVTASPDLSRCFHLRSSSKEGEESEMASIAGVLIVLPLKEAHWRDLLVGHLRETDIDAASMIAPDDAEGCAVGLHVFHVERLSGNAKAFTKLSVAYADSVARTKGWHVLGYSALTATEDGARSFERLGFRPTGYEEFWIQRDGEMSLVPLYPNHGGPSPLTEQDMSSVKGQARMTVRFTCEEKATSQ